MKRAAPLLIIVALIAGAWTHGASPIPPTGVVATRGFYPGGIDTTDKYANSRLAHFAQATVPCMSFVYTDQYGSPENVIGANTDITSGVEYPAGSLPAHQMLFSGSPNGVIVSGSYLVSDPVCPPGGFIAGQQFNERPFRHNTVGITGAGGLRNAALGDALAVSVSNPGDLSLNGTITNNAASGSVYGAVAIIASNAAPSICYIGDSLAAGQNDIVDGTGDVGNVARSIGGTFGYSSFSQGGTTLANFNSGHAVSAAIINAYCSYVIVERGINDVIGTGVSSIVKANAQALYAIFPTKRVYQTTITPSTTSLDLWATVGGQTAGTAEATRVNVNTWIRANTAAINGFFELANTVESAQDSGKWKALGTACSAPGTTSYVGCADGVHNTLTGYLAIPLGNGIPLGTFVFP